MWVSWIVLLADCVIYLKLFSLYNEQFLVYRTILAQKKGRKLTCDGPNVSFIVFFKKKPPTPCMCVFCIFFVFPFFVCEEGFLYNS